MPALLTKLLASQTDNTSEILSKVDACIVGVKTVKEQQADWRLSSTQKADLKRILTGAGARVKVQIAVIPTDRNASLMAIDILSVLKDSGWNAGDGLTSDFTLPPDLVGLVLVVNHSDFPEAVALQRALRSVGLQPNGQIDDSKVRVKEQDLIFIAIGAKPPVTQ